MSTNTKDKKIYKKDTSIKNFFKSSRSNTTQVQKDALTSSSVAENTSSTSSSDTTSKDPNQVQKDALTSSSVAENTSSTSSSNATWKDPNRSTSSVPEVATVLAHKPFHPDHNFEFPSTIMGNQARSCNWQWFKKYPWLDYSVEKDSVTCFVCKNQNKQDNLTTERSKEYVFLESGFRNWKKSLSKFDKHQASRCHIAATSNEIVIPQCGNVVSMINEKERKNMEMNRECFMEILDAIQFLARQGLPLRGDNEEESNLIQFLKLRCKSFPELNDWLEKKQNKFTSPHIQNEVLNIMSNSVVRKLLDSIRGNIYSIMADEYTDVSNKEQFTFCIRWVTDGLEVMEKFLGFYEIPNINSGTLVSVIKDIFIRYHLNPDQLRGQCYDGASNMLGKSSGVAVKIRELQPLALETHCHAHSLSLSVKDTTKGIKILRDTMGTAGEIVILIKYSPKRENILGAIKEQIECDSEEVFKVNGILKLSETRWTVRADCFKRILENYENLMKVWEHCLQNDRMQSDLKARVSGVEKQMKSFDFFFGLSMGYRLFSHTDNLSRSLQAEKLSACSSKRIANLVVSVLEGMRNEESFNNLYDAILLKAKKHSFISEPITKRKRKNPQYSVVTLLDGTSSTEPAYHPITARDHYRCVYYESLDTLTESIKERFRQPSFEAYEKMEEFLLKSIESQDVSEEIEYLRTWYSNDIVIDHLKVEKDVLCAMFKAEKIVCFHEIVNYMKKMDESQKLLIQNVVVICKLLLVNPATTATAERSFSLARRIKSWMRSRMMANRFNSMAILHAHKHITDSLNLREVAEEFVSKSSNRKFIFGKF